MAIKSKKWYKNQIKALENAARNVGNRIQQLPYNPRPEDYEAVGKYNSPIQKECKIIYEQLNQLNQLKHEYSLYYR